MRVVFGVLYFAGAAAAAAALAGCSVNPATGGQSFTAFMSPAEEQRVGAREHPRIVEQFGGAYEDANVTAYVSAIGRDLARVSDRPDLQFTFTVLDSKIVNAFALPGGYIYVTRGLVALANSEAELAGVIAHEIGHVTARHAAQRYSKSVVAGIGAAVLGALGGEAVANVAQIGTGLYLSAYSRDQEYQSDLLGVRYMSGAGYEPRAMPSFLRSLQSYSAFQARLRGDGGGGFNLLATHPRTADRVAAAIDAAVAQDSRGSRVGADEHLRRIDGLVFGGSERQGFVRGRNFVHPRLRFRFTVPPGFELMNSSQQVVARDADGSVILFDAAGRTAAGSMVAYLRDVWATNVALGELEAIDVNGMAAATGWTRVTSGRSALDVRLVAIRFDPQRTFRFMFLTPPQATVNLSRELRSTTYSFQRLSSRQAAQFRPRRIRIRAVARGETVAALARRLAVDGDHEAWFRTLNGLTPTEQPAPGRLVKIVAE